MIKLALECPKAHLEEFWKYTDYDFVLAQYILDDLDYRKFFLDVRAREPRRYCVMDNGFHELGRPLGVGELLEAAKILKPGMIVAPDRLDDPRYTIEQVRNLVRAVETQHLGFQVCGVIQGNTGEDAFKVYDAMRPFVAGIGLPFKKNRASWVSYNPMMLAEKVVHLLGGKELAEIPELRKNLTFRLHEDHIYYDTAKPIKWAMKYRKLDELKSMRSSGVAEDEFFNARLTETQVYTALENIRLLRAVLA